MYFGRYEREDVKLRVVRLEGHLALAAYVAGAADPSYFILLACGAGRVTEIRDFRYVPYIAREASFTEEGAPVTFPSSDPSRSPS